MRVRAGRTLYAIAKDAFTVGSAASCDVVIDDPAVLPLHVGGSLRERRGEFELVLAAHGPITVHQHAMREDAVIAARHLALFPAVIKLGHSRVLVHELHAPRGVWSRWFGPSGGVTSTEVAGPRPIATTKANPPPPLVPVAPAIADTAPERELLAALLHDPADPAYRLVYADWLEQHDDRLAARVVRGDAFYEVKTFAWRAMVSASPISGCAAAACPKTWDRLQPIAEDVAMRRCAACRDTVHYVYVTAHQVTTRRNVLDE